MQLVTLKHFTLDTPKTLLQDIFWKIFMENIDLQGVSVMTPTFCTGKLKIIRNMKSCSQLIVCPCSAAYS